MFSGSQKGLFWLLDKPEHKVEGTLDVDSKGRLQLATQNLLDLSDDPRGVRNICGATAKGLVTLMDVHAIGRENQNNLYWSVTTETWRCQYAFQGRSKDIDLLDEGVASVELEIQLLPDWAHRGMDFQSDWEFHRGSLSWSVEQPKPTGEWSLGKVELRHAVYPSFPGIIDRHRGAKVAIKTSFASTFDRPQSLANALDVLSSLQALVSVAKGVAVPIEMVTMAVRRNESDIWMTFHYDPVLQTDRPAAKGSELFTLEELGGMEGVGKWLDVLCGQTLLKNALLIDRYRSPAFVTDRTGHLLMGHEAYHRHSTNQAKGKVRLDEMLDPGFDVVGPEFLDWIGDRKAWKRKINRIRNEQIAHLQNLGGSKDSGGATHQVNEQLYTLLIIRILAQCDFSEYLLGQVVNRSRSDAVIRLSHG